MTNGYKSIHDDINTHEGENVSLQYEHHLQNCNIMYSTTKLWIGIFFLKLFQHEEKYSFSPVLPSSLTPIKSNLLTEMWKVTVGCLKRAKAGYTLYKSLVQHRETNNLFQKIIFKNLC